MGLFLFLLFLALIVWALFRRKYDTNEILNEDREEWK